jgi:hypothetical protein
MVTVGSDDQEEGVVAAADLLRRELHRADGARVPAAADGHTNLPVAHAQAVADVSHQPVGVRIGESRAGLRQGEQDGARTAV